MTDKIKPFVTSVVRIISHKELKPKTSSKELANRITKIGDRVGIICFLDDTFYRGTVKRFNESPKKQKMLYKDGGKETLKFSYQDIEFPDQSTESFLLA